MKKTFSVFLIIFFLSFSILPFTSLADVNLTTNVLQPTSVILNATGLTAGQTIMFTVTSGTSTPPTPNYLVSKNFTVNNQGVAFSSFTGLTSGGTYNATITATSGVVATITFKTPSGITSFSFAGLSPAVTGTISGQAISLTVPAGTDVTSLVPTIALSDTSSSVSPAAGMPQDFTKPVTYTVTAGDGSTQAYTVTVTVSTPTPTPTPTPTTDLSTKGGGLVPACPSGGCGFNEFLTMVNNVVHFVIFEMAVPIAAIMFAYAGFLLVTSGGETSKREKAKKIFWNVALGLIFAVAAWLIVHELLNVVGYDSTWNWLGF
jgi:hypothetical protein